MKTIQNFLREDSGVTALEYGLIASLIAVAIIVALGALGTQLSSMFDFIKGKIKTS